MISTKCQLAPSWQYVMSESNGAFRKQKEMNMKKKVVLKSLEKMVREDV